MIIFTEKYSIFFNKKMKITCYLQKSIEINFVAEFYYSPTGIIRLCIVFPVYRNSIPCGGIITESI